MSQDELGKIVNRSRQAIGAIEAGRHLPKRDVAEAIDAALGASGQLMAAYPGSRIPDRLLLDGYVALEAQAVGLDQFQPQILPALLQTEDYARKELEATFPPQPQQVLDEWLSTRMKRQKRHRPLAVQCVIDEGALRRQIGGPQVMAAQYAHLLDRADDPFTTIQVLPFSAGAHPVQHGACTILHLNGPESVLYLETMARSEVVSNARIVSIAERRFAALRGIALSPAESREFIASLAA